MTGNADIFSWRRDSLLATDVMLILDKKKKKRIGSEKTQLGTMLLSKQNHLYSAPVAVYMF